MAAVSPCAALYCDRLQFSESANNTGIGDSVEAGEGTTSATAIAAAARPANTIDLFRLICASNQRDP